MKINKWMEIDRQAVRWRNEKRGYPKISFDLIEYMIPLQVKHLNNLKLQIENVFLYLSLCNLSNMNLYLRSFRQQCKVESFKHGLLQQCVHNQKLF